MPVYEYECPACEKVIEVQQRMSDDPLSQCPDCGGPVKKIMSMSSFKLKGGGWYADGYASTQPAGKSASTSSTATAPPPCQSSGTCPCAAANS